MRNKYPATLKFGSAFNHYLYVRSLDGPDAETGSVDSPLGWVALMGRHLLRENDQGFVSRTTFPTRAAAAKAFVDIDLAYARYADLMED